MSLKPRPQPRTPEVELARIDADVRIQWHRVRTAPLTPEQHVVVKGVVDQLLERRHLLAPGEEL